MKYYTTIRTLNQLIRVHYDRIEAYRLAENALRHDTRLCHLFFTFRTDSSRCIEQLAQQVVHYGGTATHTSTMAGKIYRGWMQVKAGMLAEDKVTAMLQCCHFGEFVIRRAYKNLLLPGNDVPLEVRALMLNHEQVLRNAPGSLRLLHPETLGSG